MKTEEQLRREQLAKESMDLVLKRGGVTRRQLLENALHQFFNRNINLLTPEEQHKYASVIA